MLQRYVEMLQSYLEAESSFEPEWVRGAASSDTMLHLTSDELTELRADLGAIAARWEARSDPGRADARPVALIHHAFRRP